MANITIADFCENVCAMLGSVIDSDEPLSISTENGNAFLLSESYYKSLLETLYISSVPKLKDEILKRMADGDEEFVSEEEVGL